MTFTTNVPNDLCSAARMPVWRPGTSQGVPQAAVGTFVAVLVGGLAVMAVVLSPDRVIDRPSQGTSRAAATRQTPETPTLVSSVSPNLGQGAVTGSPARPAGPTFSASRGER